MMSWREKVLRQIAFFIPPVGHIIECCTLRCIFLTVATATLKKMRLDYNAL